MNPLAIGAAVLGGLLVVYELRKSRAAGSTDGTITPPDLGPQPLPSSYPVPDFGGKHGAELQRAKDNGWDVAFAAAEQAHNLPLGSLAPLASRETNTKNIVGDYGHGRGLMQIDDQHGAWLKAHGVPNFVKTVTKAEKDENGVSHVTIVTPGDGGMPDVPAAIDYAAGLIESAIKHGRSNGVAEDDLMKFAYSSYNAGEGTALQGYKNHGDSDAFTTKPPYGADTLNRFRSMYPAQGDPVIPPPAQVAGWGGGRPRWHVGGDKAPVIGAVGAALAPALVSLLAQVDGNWPNRSKVNDGSTEDTDEPDHLAGNGIDITSDPANGPDLHQLAEVLLGDPRTHYVIFESRIANRDIMGGAWRDYPERDEGESDADYATRAKGYNAHTRHLHLSVRQSGRADASGWPKGSSTDGPIATANPKNPAPPVESDARLPGLLKTGIASLWDQGLVDNFRWVPIKVGEYEVQVMADGASVYGLRMPASFADMLHMVSTVNDILPITKPVADAIWANAAKRIVLDPIGPAEIANGHNAAGVAQVQKWDAEMGPISTGPLYDGASKDWILESGIADGKAVNYGLRKADGSVWQTPGHGHDDAWKDYSQLARFMKRQATKTGQPVDLLEELKTGSSLGGPLPTWILNRLQGGVS